MSIFEITDELFSFDIKDFYRIIPWTWDNKSIIWTENNGKYCIYFCMREELKLILTIMRVFKVMIFLFGLHIKDFNWTIIRTWCKEVSIWIDSNCIDWTFIREGLIFMKIKKIPWWTSLKWLPLCVVTRSKIFIILFL